MKERCSLCHKETIPIEIHGHTQCSVCKGNYSPCCQGEQAMPTEKKHTICDADVRRKFEQSK